MSAWMRVLAGTMVVVLACAGLVWWLGVHDGVDVDGADTSITATPEVLARGAYLAQAGNCMACHTRRGDAPYAGGRPIATPFGTVFSSNLTPDTDTGIGAWSAAQFWRAVHHGRSRDGRLLLPAFPYTSYTRVTRDDSDALWAYLRSLPAVPRAAEPHQLRWPYNTQWALAIWRALYFRAGEFVPRQTRGVEWNRGAYLVQGLGHCDACHAPRNLLGASTDAQDLAGGQIPMQGWYAPSLLDAAEAGVAQWDPAHVVQLLQTGVSPRGSVLGPMAEVVLRSTQHLSQGDLRAMAIYLQTLPQGSRSPRAPEPAPSHAIALGARVYKRHCADCHGEGGEGVALAYPPLASNRAVRMDNSANLVQVVLRGGFSPATAGNPRPFGMPPFQMLLSDAEVAAVISYIRNAWGNDAGGVTELDVAQHRARPMQ